MDQPVFNNAQSIGSPRSIAGAGMDRAVAPSRTKKAVRYAVRYGGPVVVLLLAWGAWKFVPASGTLSVSSDQLQVAVVRSAPFLDYLPVRATVAPLNVTFVDAVQGGEVLQLIAHDGALVKEGDVLAKLTNPQLQLDVTSREAQIASQLGSVSAQQLTLQQSRTAEETQMAEARYNLLKAQRELSIREQLHGQGFESDANVQSYRDESDYYAQRLKRLNGAQTQDLSVFARQEQEITQEAERLRSNLSVVRESLNSLILRAPVAGRVTNFELQPGQSLKAGDKIAQIDSEGQYRLDADIDEFYLGRVVVGERATASFGDVVVPMTVSREIGRAHV